MSIGPKHKKRVHVPPLAVEVLPPEVRCQYPSKFCNNHKAQKVKGDLHKFCEYHRRKANLNQKRWQQRRREELHQRTKPHVIATSNPAIPFQELTLQSTHVTMSPIIFNGRRTAEPFPSDELHALTELLFSERDLNEDEISSPRPERMSLFSHELAIV